MESVYGLLRVWFYLRTEVLLHEEIARDGDG